MKNNNSPLIMPKQTAQLDAFYESLGIYYKAFKKFNLKIFPNPVYNSLEIEISDFNKNDAVQYDIYDYLGKVLSKKISYPELALNDINLFAQVDLSYLPAGLYFVRAHNSSNSVTKSFIKK